MAYNVVYTADGLTKCVSDEYLEHKYGQQEERDREKEKLQKYISKRQAEDREYQSVREKESDWKTTQEKISRLSDLAAKRNATRRRFKIQASGLKAASAAAVNYLDKNSWTRSKVVPSDGLNKCIFIKTKNGKTKYIDIPIAVFENSLIERAEKTGFSISKYADTIRNRLQEAKNFDRDSDTIRNRNHESKSFSKK